MTSGRIRDAATAFRLKARVAGLTVSFALGAAGLLPSAATAGQMAVIPTQTIYPGEVVEASRLEEVAVTNPNIVQGFATSIADVKGKVSKRTLLPGRVIPANALREPYAVERGTTVQIVVSVGTLTISAKGSPLQDAAIGDLIRVRNIDSGVIVAGTVMADGTVQVVAK